MDIEAEALSPTAEGTGPFATGRKSAITTAVQVIATAQRAVKGVTLVADSANTVAVYIGFSNAITDDDADATDGFPLYPGQSKYIAIDDASKIWATADSSSKLWWMTE